MENYEVLQTIGSGSFGTVKKVRRKEDGRILVWKEMNYGNMSEKEKQLLVTEVNILREFRHPHIVRYYDRIIDRTNKKIYIVQEFCEGGDLGQLIKKCKRENSTIDEENVWKIFVQVLLALKECHTRKDGVILHRDIKPGNIFLDNQHNVKLGDFGLARILGPNSLFACTNLGTPYYMSPEQTEEKAYNEKSDIWALGCVVYEIVTMHPPFEAANQVALSIKIRSGQYKDLPLPYSDDLRRVIRMMLTVDQLKRPSVEQILELACVSIRVRERRLNQNYYLLKKREEELNAKEEELRRREMVIMEREKRLGIIYDSGNNNINNNNTNNNNNMDMNNNKLGGTGGSNNNLTGNMHGVENMAPNSNTANHLMIGKANMGLLQMKTGAMGL